MGSMKNLSPALYDVATTPSAILMVKYCGKGRGRVKWCGKAYRQVVVIKRGLLLLPVPSGATVHAEHNYTSMRFAWTPGYQHGQ